MPEQSGLFDEDGFPVDVDSLEVNDVVYDAEGNPGVIVPDDEYEADDEFEDDIELVGKAGGIPRAFWGAMNAGSRSQARVAAAGQRGVNAGKRARKKVSDFYHKPNDPGHVTGPYSGGLRWGRVAATAGVPVAGGGAAYGAKRYNDGRVEASKALGDVVLEELSKAASEDERSEIIAAAMQEVEIAKAQAQEAMAYAQAAEDEQVTMAFISKAAEYNLPVAPEILGPILKSASEVLTDEELDVLDQLFSGIGEYLYEELGVVGDTDNDDVYSQVDLAARELVGKADGSISPEMATTMMFENNPAAYEQYLAENGR